MSNSARTSLVTDRDKSPVDPAATDENFKVRTRDAADGGGSAEKLPIRRQPQQRREGAQSDLLHGGVTTCTRNHFQKPKSSFFHIS